MNRIRNLGWNALFRALRIVLALGVIVPLAGAAESVTKEAMLSGILNNVIVPEYAELSAKCRELSAAAEQLAKTPTADSFGKTRQAWMAAQRAARHVQWLQTGPIADLECLSTFYYSKLLTGQIEDILRPAQPINEPYLAGFSPSSRNLFTMEYLLFPKPSDPAVKEPGGAALDPVQLFGTNFERRSQYVLAVARTVQSKADKIAESWASTNRQDAAAKFLAGGQTTLNSLVNQMAKIIEVLAESHLNFALHLPNPIASQMDRIEGNRSASTLLQLQSMLNGLHKTYRGGDGVGMDDYAKGLNPALEARVEQQFQKAIAALEAIQPPLESALTERKDSVQRAFDAVHALEILFKVDLASALGVTITFNSNDGD